MMSVLGERKGGASTIAVTGELCLKDVRAQSHSDFPHHKCRYVYQHGKKWSINYFKIIWEFDLFFFNSRIFVLSSLNGKIKKLLLY